MTDERAEIAERLYGAFEARDAPALLDLLHPEFVGDVTSGLPHGWGGVYHGPEDMLQRCWGRVFADLDTRPVPEELIATTDGRLIVLGHYRGTFRESGRAHEARFAHVLRFADGRVAALEQITDSARWDEGLGS